MEINDNIYFISFCCTPDTFLIQNQKRNQFHVSVAEDEFVYVCMRARVWSGGS